MVDEGNVSAKGIAKLNVEAIDNRRILKGSNIFIGKEERNDWASWQGLSQNYKVQLL